MYKKPGDINFSVKMQCKWWVLNGEEAKTKLLKQKKSWSLANKKEQTIN